MPFIIEEPSWGFDRDYVQQSNYITAMNHGTYIMNIKGFNLYKEESKDVHTYYLLDDLNQKIVYKSKFLNDYGNDIFSQNLVWRNKHIESLKGIATILIKEYYLDFYKMIYSDTCQSLDGKRMWVNMMFHYPELEYGYFDSFNHYCIENIEELYHKGSNIALYVKQ